ncbi:RNA polymerase sigma factor [Neorhizobium sp. NCHU2750]|uniref:RNA polymerase sigma factor n=1 Tax=Neorhizobium sp. NCHU2750 TaxID=1825976 RepID=UPI000E748071
MSGWRERIGSLFQTHHQKMESFLRRKGANADLAADLVQDVFARTLAAGPRASETDDVRVLYASARNAVIESHRSQRRRGDILSSLVPEQLTCDIPSPEDRLEARQTLRALDIALAELSPRCREIFLLRRVEGLSNSEIARRQGISINSVEKHIARALRHCQKCLAGDRANS